MEPKFIGISNGYVNLSLVMSVEFFGDGQCRLHFVVPATLAGSSTIVPMFKEFGKSDTVEIRTALAQLQEWAGK